MRIVIKSSKKVDEGSTSLLFGIKATANIMNGPGNLGVAEITVQKLKRLVICACAELWQN